MNLRTAVIGAGHLGRIHARLLQSQADIELVGIVDPLEAARNQAASELGIPAFASVQEVADRIDAAIIATVTTQHHAVGIELLRRGIHLLIEKPIASTLEEADDLVLAAAERDRVLQIGHVERFNPAWLAAAPHLHQPYYFECRRASGYSGRSIDIGVVLDLMVHDIDLVLSLVPSPIVHVQSIGNAVFGPHEDFAQARLTFANGCVANFFASRISDAPQRIMHAYTSEGFASLDFATGQAKLVRPTEQVLHGEIDVGSMTLEQRTHLRDRLFEDYLPITELSGQKRNAIHDEQRDFFNAVQEHRTPQVSGRDGRNVLAVCEQILFQAREWRQHAAILSHTGDSISAIPFPSNVPTRRKAG